MKTQWRKKRSQGKFCHEIRTSELRNYKPIATGLRLGLRSTRKDPA